MITKLDINIICFFIYYLHILHIIYYSYISRTVSATTYWHHKNCHTVYIQIHCLLVLFFFTSVKFLRISIFKLSFHNIFTKFSSTFIIVYLYYFFLILLCFRASVQFFKTCLTRQLATINSRSSHRTSY